MKTDLPKVERRFKTLSEFLKQRNEDWEIALCVIASQQHFHMCPKWLKAWKREGDKYWTRKRRMKMMRRQRKQLGL